ncbi:hypothetical protein [Xenorhabdus littoralis]|uniref:hypothetical protein n=1 Tax=Xenorhabdus littoralis TaxID=2582835 RepID=UPI0029E8039C|nr:hypothetical protein [Xenorhabdus sp. psl]MDX7992358.1 hypothetical protein [Xenorhabdus sp. psl]
MNIPKKIHYFWVGNKISERDLRRIIAIKSENRRFEVNIWGTNDVESLISHKLRNINFKYNKNDIDVGILFGREFRYRNIETAFSFLISQTSCLNHTYSMQDLYDTQRAELAKFGIRTNNDSTKTSCLCYKHYSEPDNDYSKVMHFLHHVFVLQMHGDFKSSFRSYICNMLILNCLHKIQPSVNS